MAEPVDELRTVQQRERNLKLLVRALAGLLAIAAVAFTVVAVVLLHSLDTVERQSSRSDCSREYTGLITRNDRALSTSGWLQADRLGSALFQSASTGQRASAQEIADFGKGSVQLHHAIAKVLMLPDIDVAVDHGFTLDGVKHPPCPKV